jgi:hypothetical protein
MTAPLRFSPAPVGQQGPPARAAASTRGRVTPRRARVPPIDYGDGLG